MRVSEEKMNSSLQKQIEIEFAQVIVDMRDLDEAQIFVRDFFNENERQTFVKRLAIGYWLKKKRGYITTKLNLKVSTATLAMVNIMSKKPGFQLALKKMEAEEWANQWADRIKGIVKKK
jgi:uncharacterized protein YerC